MQLEIQHSHLLSTQRISLQESRWYTVSLPFLQEKQILCLRILEWVSCFAWLSIPGERVFFKIFPNTMTSLGTMLQYCCSDIHVCTRTRAYITQTTEYTMRLVRMLELTNCVVRVTVTFCFLFMFFRCHLFNIELNWEIFL